jgi:hypothetical protein
MAARLGHQTSSEIIFALAISPIEVVAAILGSKGPRRLLTPNQRALLIERGRCFRFLGNEDGANEPLARPDSTNGR